MAHYLQQPTGRLFQFTCDADLGDARCGVNLEESAYRGVGEILAVLSPRAFEVSGLGDHADGWCTRGLLRFTSGANAGQSVEIRSHAVRDGVVSIELWQEPARAMSEGDTVTVTAGCDKQLETCRTKFGNAVNFRGFPHMPGNDFVTSYVRGGR